MNNNFQFTSESVSPGHPDKLSDQLSDAVLDYVFASDKNARVACEVLTKGKAGTAGTIVVAGEITSSSDLDFDHKLRETICDVGYDSNNLGFNGKSCEIIKLINEEATRANLNIKLKELRTKLTEKDNLLIYYSGHGQRDDDTNQAFWQLYDAEYDAEHTWADLDASLSSHLRAMKAGHVLVVVDSCFSGKLFKQRSSEKLPVDKEYKTILQDYNKFNSRLGLTASDATKPIPDGGAGGKHSIFSNRDIRSNGNLTFSWLHHRWLFRQTTSWKQKLRNYKCRS